MAPWGCDYGADNWTEISVDAPFFKPEQKWEMKCIEAPTVIRRNGDYRLSCLKVEFVD